MNRIWLALAFLTGVIFTLLSLTALRLVGA